MINLILATSIAAAHSGDTDTSGCHAGSKPYHCHGSTHIEFDTVDIKGELVKPAIQYVKEDIRVDPCEKHAGTDEWIECSINLSYEEISSLCAMTRTNPIKVKDYLDVLVNNSLRELIYESTGKDGWQYRYNAEEDFYRVVNSPGGRWNGKELNNDTKAYKNVYKLHSELLKQRITSIPSADYKDRKVTTWQSCNSNGLDKFNDHWYTQVRGSHDSFGEFVAWPTPAGVCKEGERFEAWGRGGTQTYCREFVGALSMQKTIYTKDPVKTNESITHHFDLGYGAEFSMPDMSMHREGWYRFPISSSMIVVVNGSTNEFGIVYRQVHNEEGMNRAGGPMVFEPEASAAHFKEVLKSSPLAKPKAARRKSVTSWWSKIIQNLKTQDTYVDFGEDKPIF